MIIFSEFFHEMENFDEVHSGFYKHLFDNKKPYGIWPNDKIDKMLIHDFIEMVSYKNILLEVTSNRVYHQHEDITSLLSEHVYTELLNIANNKLKEYLLED